MKVFIFEIMVFWDLMACSLVYGNQYLRNMQNRIWVEDQTKHRYEYGSGGTRIGVLRGPIRGAEKNTGQNNGKLRFNSSRGSF
jgi:hypothetical protein